MHKTGEYVMKIMSKQ